MSELVNLSDLKSFDTKRYEYDNAHRELAENEQDHPCTCMLKAQRRTGSAFLPSLLTREDVDPDCELHLPWMIEDEKERMHLMRYWMAGYQVGFETAMRSVDNGKV